MSQIYIGYDLETGDLDPNDGDLLTGFFAVMDEDFKIIDELGLKLKPEGRLPVANPRALEVNKIDLRKHVEDAETVTYAEGKTRLIALLKKHLKKRGKYSNLQLLGYNIKSFDNNWLYHHVIPKKELETLVHYKCLDVMEDVDVLKRHGWLPPTCGTLTSMVEFFDIPKTQAHDAKNDILMTIQVFLKIRALLESKKNLGTSQDIIALLEQE